MILITEGDMIETSEEEINRPQKEKKKPETLVELIPRPYVGMDPIRTTSENQIMFTGMRGERWSFIGRHISGQPTVSMYTTLSKAKVTREGKLAELSFERLITKEDPEHQKYDSMLRSRKIEY